MLIRRDEHTIDRGFRQKLYDAEDEVPLHLWEGVRSKRKRRRPIFWWWTAAFVLLGVSIGTSLLWNNKKEENTLVDNQKPVTQSVDISSPKNQPKTETFKSNEFDSKDLSQTKNSSKQTITETPAKDETIFSDNKLSSQVKPASKDIETKESRKKVNHVVHEHAPDVFTHYPIMFLDKDITTTQRTLVVPDSSENKIELSNDFTSELEKDVMKHDNMPFVTAANSKINPTRNNGRWMFGAYYVIANPYRVASKGSDAAAFAELNNRTSLRRSQTMGLAFGYRIYKGLYIGSGIESMEFTEDHTWVDSVQTIDYTTDVVYQVVYEQDQLFPSINLVLDTLEHHNSEVHDGQQRNTYKSINLPLYAGYQFPIWKRFSLSAEAGPVFRVERTYQGSFKMQQATADLPAGSQSSTLPVYINQYYSNWKMDLYSGMSLGYNLKSGIGLTVGGQCRWMIGEVGSQKAVLHRIIQPGIRFGLNYWF